MLLFFVFFLVHFCIPLFSVISTHTYRRVTGTIPVSHITFDERRHQADKWCRIAVCQRGDTNICLFIAFQVISESQSFVLTCLVIY